VALVACKPPVCGALLDGGHNAAEAAAQTGRVGQGGSTVTTRQAAASQDNGAMVVHASKTKALRQLAVTLPFGVVVVATVLSPQTARDVALRIRSVLFLHVTIVGPLLVDAVLLLISSSPPAGRELERNRQAWGSGHGTACQTICPSVVSAARPLTSDAQPGYVPFILVTSRAGIPLPAGTQAKLRPRLLPSSVKGM
jgi:hypothetical protein